MAIDLEDRKAVEKSLESLHTELGSVTDLLAKSTKALDEKYAELHTRFDGLKADNDETAEAVKKGTKEYADLLTEHKALQAGLEQVKKELDAPIHKGGKDLEETDRKNAIELQRRAHIHKGGDPDAFVADMDNLVNVADLRSATRKLMRVGIDSKERIRRTFTSAEQKAFEAANLDSGFFMPEMLGYELDCEIECADLLNLYAQFSVSRSTFMFPHIKDYGAIGQYSCPAKCDAELGPEGNIEHKNGRTYDWRGVFCFNRNVLAEASYDLLGFMTRAVARSYRINRNRALISGDGVNEPLGWMTADCFPKLTTPQRILTTGGTAKPSFNHIDARKFIASHPQERGPITAVIMHQNVFAYLASIPDANGRFIFGDGLLSYNPSSANEVIRISNCLPDATAGLTRGSDAVPFVAGDFLIAAGNWSSAFANVNKRPMFIEQFEAQSTAWCVSYQFGAEDGGFTLCCENVRQLIVG